MKKWIYIAIGTVIVVAAVLIFGLSNLGPIIKSAVNSYGPEITETKVHIADVNVDLFSGEAKIKNFLLGNPAGYKSPDAIKVGSVLVQVNEKSLASDTIIVDKIEVINPQITFEHKGEGNNFLSILNNVKKNLGDEKLEQKSKKQGTEKKLIIRDFIIKNGDVNLALSIAKLGNKDITSPLPEIHLTNIGENSNGVTPTEAFNEIFTVLYGKILSPAVTEVFNKQLKTLGVNLDLFTNDAAKQLGTTGKTMEDKMTVIGKQLKGLFGK